MTVGDRPLQPAPGHHLAEQQFDLTTHPVVALAAAGWWLVPLYGVRVDGSCQCGRHDCHAVGKHPCTLHGVRDASNDLRIVRVWLERYGFDSNWGMPTGHVSGIVAVDVDPRNGGTESLAALEAEHGPLPPTLTNITGGGGFHLLYAVQGAYPSRKLAPGIDLQGDGKYVVIPPSRHRSGQQYAWRDPQAAIVPVPDVLSRIEPPRSTVDPVADGQPVYEGYRNDAIYRKAEATWLLTGDPLTAKAAAHAFNVAWCRPPLEVGEVDRTIASAVTRPPLSTEQVTWALGLAPSSDPDVEREYKREAARREALRRLDDEQAARLWTPPPSTLTVADELALPDEPVDDTIASLCRRGHNVATEAEYKTGKTTLQGNVLRSLVDGELFLGSFTPRPLSGRVGFWNYELQPDEFRAFLRRLNLQRPDRAAVLHLRGYRMPLRVEHIERWVIDWLTQREVEVLILDPWARVMSGNGSENSNDDVTLLTETLDAIKQAAGVTDLFVTAHTPRQEMEEGAERARGAARLDDWADARWVYTRDPDGNRYLRVEGRGVALDETRLAYNLATERLTVAGGSRRQERGRVGINEVIELVRADPGVPTTALKDRMTSTTNNGERTRAVQQALGLGAIRYEPGPKNSKRWFPVWPDWPGNEGTDA